MKLRSVHFLLAVGLRLFLRYVGERLSHSSDNDIELALSIYINAAQSAS
jgi:hypothetical protein